LAKIEIIDKDDVINSIIIRMPKTYPAYFGSYDQIHIIRKFTNKFENFFKSVEKACTGITIRIIQCKPPWLR
jgi:hypothetical protein